MAAIDLPPLPRWSTCSPRLVRFGVDLRPGLGGPVFRSRRLGTRYAVDVKLPPLKDCAGAWLAAFLRADTEQKTLRLTFPQLAVADPGAVVVSGAGQAGSALNVSGGDAVTLPAAAFFSVEVSGVSYLHATTEEHHPATDSNLAFAPMLRASPADGAALKFTGAVIEGLYQGDTIGWDLEVMKVHGISFSIEEAR